MDISPETLSQIESTVLVVLGALSALVPFARWVAARTESKTDDALVEKVATFIHDSLRYIPTLRIGATLETQKVIEAVKEIPESPKVPS